MFFPAINTLSLSLNPIQSYRALGPALNCQGHPGAGAAAEREAADEHRRAQGCSLWSGWKTTTPQPAGPQSAPPRCYHPDASEALW